MPPHDTTGLEPTEITAGRLHLRPWQPSDADAVFTACQDPEIQRWTTVPSPYTLEDARTWCTTVAPGGWAAGTAASFAVVDAISGSLVASMGLHAITETSADVGYWCAVEARGHGVISESLAAVCRWAFASLGVQRIGWVAGVGNWGSRAAAQKCGFTMEGTARAGLVQRGQRVDVWTAGLLRDDELVDRRPLPTPPTLTDGVVTLRGWRVTDAPECARACNDPVTAQWLPVPVPYTVADGEDYVEGHVFAAWATGSAAELAVTDAVTGELLGATGLKLGGRHLGYGEVGYWTAPWARGRGVAGRGAALSARWGLDVLGLNRVELLAGVDNVASQRAAEKAGFEREGVARRARANREGEPRDMVQFSLVRA